LPAADLGLGAERPLALLREYFPAARCRQRPIPARPAGSRELQRCCRDHLTPGLASAAWMVDILTAACVGRDHCGRISDSTTCRTDRLMLINFPASPPPTRGHEVE
jgi:hypothetical protein